VNLAPSNSAGLRPPRRRWPWLAACVAAAGIGWTAFVGGAEPRAPEPRTAPPAATTRGEDTAAREPRVRGRVLGPDGRAVHGAEVALFAIVGNEVELPPPLPGASTRSLPDGSFVLPLPAQRDLAAGARKAGLISALVPVADGSREIVLRMANAYEVRGYVSDSFGPVEGCEVVLEPEADRLFAHVTRTDADGAFRFANIYPGRVSLSARSPRFRPAVRHGIVVGSGEPLHLPFREEALTLRGRVWLDGDEARPAANGKVRAFALRDERLRARAVPQVADVGPDGRFELLGLGPGLHRVEFAHDERSTAVRTIEVGPGMADVEVRLPRRASVRGRLVGAELVGTELLLVTEAREHARTRTDTGGRFEFAATFSAGPATLVLLDRAVCFERTWSRRVAIEVGGEALILSVAPATLIAGEVDDANGAPVEGVEVYVEAETYGLDRLRGPAGVTDQHGSYRVHVAPSDAVNLVFRHPDYAIAMLRLPQQASGVQQTVTLHRPSRVAGIVARDGRPLPAAIVHLPEDGPARAWATTGPDGEFTLHGVPPGEHQLLVRHGTRTEFSQKIVVEPDRDSVGIEIVLPPVRTVNGRVTDEQGRPVPGVLASIDGAIGEVATGADGTFELDAPRGDIVVRVFAPEWRIEKQVPVAAAGTRADVVLPLPPHGTVRSRLHGVPGRRPDGALLTLRPRVGGGGTASGLRQWVDVRDGVLRCDRLPAGQWTLQVHCHGYAPWQTEIDLRAGEAIDLGDTRLEPGAVVRGVVLDDRGRPLPGARVLLGAEQDLFVVEEAERTRGEDIFGTRSDVRGRFELGGVSSRLHELVVRAPGYATATVTLQIPADLLRREPLEVRLAAGVDLVAQVLDGSGQPLPGRSVELRKGEFLIEAARTDGEGRCVFQNRSRGEYRLSVVGAPAQRTVEVLSQQTYHVTLELPD